MRFLTINALMQYGQKLYDRGNFNEACNVFNHVLSFDGHQALALKYIKEMGRVPVTITIPAPQPVSLSPAKTFLTLKRSHELNESKDVLFDNESLKRAIRIKKQRIEALRVQIMQMRLNLVSQSKEE